MTVRVLLVMFSLVWTIMPSPARSQTLTLSEPWFQMGPTEHTWKYRIELTDLRNKETVFILSLRLPERTQVHDINEQHVTSRSSRRAPFTDVRIRAKKSETVTLTVTGPAGAVTAGSPVEHQWHVVGNLDRETQRASAPAATEASFARIVGVDIDPTVLLITGRYISSTDGRDPGELTVFDDGKLRANVQLAGVDFARRLQGDKYRLGLNTGLGITEYEDAGLVLFSASLFFQVQSYYRLEVGRMFAVSGREGLDTTQRDRGAVFFGVSFSGLSDGLKKLLAD